MATLLETQEAEAQQGPLPRRERHNSDKTLSMVKSGSPERILFSDSLLSSYEWQRRGLTTTVSLVFQCLVLGMLLILPLMFTEALPTQQLLTFLMASPQPPPLPPPTAVPVAKVAQSNMLNTGQLRTPTRIPRRVQMVREEEAPPPALAGGIVGGIPGGVPGGQLSGVIGGLISSTSNSTPAIPRREPVRRVRVSQGVTQGMVILKVEPEYPKIALAARITGVVQLKAVISKDGNIIELQLVSGSPLLVPAAIDAVRQWHYRPYLLNGAPVEVETNITVTFQITS